MEIPVISDNILLSLRNQLENGFDMNVKGNAETYAKRGIYEMECLLEIDEEGSYRKNIISLYYGDKILNKQMNPFEKTISWFFLLLGFTLVIVSFLAFAWYLIITLNHEDLNELPSFIRELSVFIHGKSFLVNALADLFLIILGYIIMTSPIKHFKKKYKNVVDEVIKKIDPWVMFEYSNKKISCMFIMDTSLAIICKKLGVDSTEAKVGLGKVKGGGSTFVGWGSSGMVGAGIGLSALSSIGAAAKNSAINDRIKELENYIFYNNVASYFNDTYNS